MKKFREKLYQQYVTSHTSHLYHKASLNGTRSQFSVWKQYFGKAFPKTKGARILDMGCGNGSFIYFLQSLGYKNSQGIDISKEQVEEARKLGIRNIECHEVMDFLKDRCCLYDVIFARDVIEHFTKDEIIGLLTFIFNSLKHGGRFVIQAPNAESLFGSRLRYTDFTHEIAFTETSLNQLLRVVGFKEVYFYPAGPVPKGVKSAIRFILWKIIESFLKFYVLVETGTPKGIYTQNVIAIARK